jgi:hypothetical protein
VGVPSEEWLSWVMRPPAPHQPAASPFAVWFRHPAIAVRMRQSLHPSSAQPSQAQVLQTQPSSAQPSQAQVLQTQPSSAQPLQAQVLQAQPSRAGFSPGQAAPPASRAQFSGLPGILLVSPRAFFPLDNRINAHGDAPEKRVPVI